MPIDPDNSAASAAGDTTISARSRDVVRAAPSRSQPATIAGYRIVGRIGEGGMGVVYEAEQPDPKRMVALKIIRAGQHASESQLRMFRREVQALARLKHAGIASIYEAGATEDGQPFFTMELVQGVSLAEYIRAHPAEGADGLRRRLALFRKVGDAISYAHQRGVIHRDLKPTNIVVVSDTTSTSTATGADRLGVKVLDFGLARTVDTDSATTLLTEAGQIKGTLPYMSPEQVRGAPEDIDARSDVYSAGVILYELLTDRLPHDLDQVTFVDAIRVITEVSPKTPTRVWKEARSGRTIGAYKIDPDLETIVMTALEKDPARRYQSMAALVEDLDRYLGNQPILARPPSALYQFRKLVARHKAPFAFLAALFLVLVGFSITMAIQAGRIAEQRDRAVDAEAAASTERDAAMQARDAERTQRSAAERARTDERAQRLLAETNFTRAETQRLRAEAQERTNLELLYAAQMNLAQQAWEAADVTRVHELLRLHEPPAASAPLRGFEWTYLARISRSELATLPGPAWIRSAKFSPDGTRLAAASDDGTVRIWDALSHRALGVFAGHRGLVAQIAFAPDGARLASTGADGTLRVWAVDSGRSIFAVNAHKGATSVAFSPDGARLVTAGAEGVSKVWDSATGREIVAFSGHTGRVTSAVFSSDGARIATASFDGSARIWDVASGQPVRTFTADVNNLFTVALSPDGKWLATGGVDQTARIWDVDSGRQLLVLRGHRTTVFSVAFSPDGRTLATASGDRTVRLWRTTTGRELRVYRGHAEGVSTVAFSSDGRRIVTGGSDRTVKLWDATSDAGVTSRAVHTMRINAITYSRDGRFFATASLDGAVKIVDTATNKEVRSLPHAGPVNSVAFSPDGALVASASSPAGLSPGDPYRVTLWSVATGQVVATFDPGRGADSVAFSPDGRSIAWGSARNAVIRRIATDQGAVTLTGSDDFHRVAFSPDGTKLASTGLKGSVTVWDATDGRRLLVLEGHVGAVGALVYSPTGRWLATAGRDRTVRFWDSRTGRPILTLAAHGAEVTGLAIAPDGKRIASSGVDRLIKLWTIDDGQQVLALATADTPLSLAFSPDGMRLAAGGAAGSVAIWSAR